MRVCGRVEKLSREESDAYFQSRPRGSRLGAWASKQSSVIGEDTLEQRVKAIEEKFGAKEEDGPVECPDFWGGWRVVPECVKLPFVLCPGPASSHVAPPCSCSEVEFWSGQPSRLHDRFRYLRQEDGADGEVKWKVDRLSP